MALTVSTPAQTRLLTTVARVQAALGITTDTDLLDAYVRRASAAIESYCHREFARQTVTETVPGYGDVLLDLSLTPLVTITSVTADSETLTDYSIADRLMGTLYRRAGWSWTVQTFGGLSASEKFLDFGMPLPRQEEPQFSVVYTAGYLLPGQNVIGTTLSASAVDNSFNDSASGFPSLLKAGDVIETTGFSTSANNGRWIVSGTPTTAKIVVSGTLSTDAASTATTMVRVANLPDDVELAALEASKAFYLTRNQDPSLAEKQAGPMRLRYAERPDDAPYGLPPNVVGLLRPWVRVRSAA